MHYKTNRLLVALCLIITTYMIITMVALTAILNELKKEEPQPRTELKVVTMHDYVYNEQMAYVKKDEPKVINNTKIMSNNKETNKTRIIDDELYLLAQIIDAEAIGEPYEGKVAVGNVVLNRVESPEFPDSIKDVVYQKGQFSPISNGAINRKPSKESLQAAEDVLDGERVLGEDVLFFYNPKISTSKWIFKREVVEKIGNHVFAL